MLFILITQRAANWIAKGRLKQLDKNKWEIENEKKKERKSEKRPGNTIAVRGGERVMKLIAALIRQYRSLWLAKPRSETTAI